MTPSPSVASVASRFSGVWRCDGYAAEDSGTQSFMREASDTIALVGAYDSGKLEADRFSYDAARAVWQLSTVASLTPLLATSMLGDRWVFSGSEGDRRQPHAVRVVFTALGPAAFRREHQIPVRDGWVDDGEAVCRRTSESPTPSPSPAPSRRPTVVARAVARVVRPSPSPTPSPAPSPRDRAYRLLGRTWDCETIEGNSAPHDYRLAADGSLLLHTQLSEGRKSYPIDERYRFDRARNVWTATTIGTSYASTAPPWFDDKWVFNGVESVNGVRVPVRMIYTDLDEHAFRRDFRQLRGDTWQTIASETCTRR